jgi:2-oxoglutarate ferredoxin oxidoreductase subunit delta
MSHIVVLEDRCRGCGLCVAFCPRSVLAPAGRLNTSGLTPAEMANPENCVGCATCALMCPHLAITLVERTPKVRTEVSR